MITSTIVRHGLWAHLRITHHDYRTVPSREWAVLELDVSIAESVDSREALRLVLRAALTALDGD